MQKLFNPKYMNLINVESTFIKYQQKKLLKALKAQQHP